MKNGKSFKFGSLLLLGFLGSCCKNEKVVVVPGKQEDSKADQQEENEKLLEYFGSYQKNPESDQYKDGDTLDLDGVNIVHQGSVIHFPIKND